MQILCFFLFLFKGSSNVVCPPCCPVQVLSFALCLHRVFLSEQNKDDDDDKHVKTRLYLQRDGLIEMNKFNILIQFNGWPFKWAHFNTRICQLLTGNCTQVTRDNNDTSKP